MAKTALFVGTDERLERELRKQLGERGYTVSAFVNAEQELTSEELIARQVQKLYQQAGQIDLFIWGALYPGLTSLEELTLPAYQAYMHKAVHSAFYFSKACIKVMEKKRSGRILFLTNIAATLGELDVLFTVANGCLNTFVKSVAREEGRRGITANALMLGRIEDWEITHQPVIDSFYQHYYPFREEIDFFHLAQTIVHLTTEETSTLNGQLVKLDGGTL